MDMNGKRQFVVEIMEEDVLSVEKNKMKKENNITWSDFLGVDIGLNENTCLAKVNPELAKEWNYEKNGNLTPNDVTPNSNKKAWWKGKCGHEWLDSVNHRNIGRGCPYCSGRNSSKKLSYNEAKTYIDKYKIKSKDEWIIFTRSKNFNYDVLPKAPYSYYKKTGEWISWPDFLGKG